MIDTLLAQAHLVSTVMMAGLIWFVQIVHYPLFGRVGENRFITYECEHQSRTTLVVAPLMLVEALTAVWLVLSPPEHAPVWLAPAGLGLVVVNWVSTAAVQAPTHKALSRGYDPKTHRRLVVSNWVRTGAWTARVPIALAMMSSSSARAGLAL